MKFFKNEPVPILRNIIILPSGDFTFPKVIDDNVYKNSYHKFTIVGSCGLHIDVFYKYINQKEFLLEAKHLGYMLI